MKLFSIKGNVIKLIADVLKPILTTIPFKCDKDGILIANMDASHTILMRIKIPKSQFEEYEITDGEEFILDVEALQKFLTKSSEKETVVFHLEDNKVRVERKGRTTLKGNFATFDEKTIDNDPATWGSFASKAVLNPADIKDALSMIADVGKTDHIDITINSKKVEIYGGDSINRVGITFELNDEKDNPLKSIESRCTSESSYNLMYTLDLLKNLKIPEIELNISEDSPFMIVGKIGEITMQCILAPRIDDTKKRG